MSGNLFLEEDRRNFRLMGSIGCIGILLLAVFMWHLFWIAQDKLLFLLIALIATAAAGYYLWSGYRNYQLFFASYEITDMAVLHLPNGKAYTFALSGGYEIRKVNVSLYMGKADRYFRFLLLSSNTKEDVQDCYYGIASIQKILNCGFLVLPVEAENLLLRP